MNRYPANSFRYFIPILNKQPFSKQIRILFMDFFNRIY